MVPYRNLNFQRLVPKLFIAMRNQIGTIGFRRSMNIVTAYSPLPVWFMGTMNFGEWLREERTRRGLSARQLAERADTTHASISRFETGTRTPSRFLAIQVADALAGPDALPEDRQRLRNEALRAFAGLDGEDAPEMTSEPWDEDTIEVAHFYSGIADPRMKAFVKRVIRDAVEIGDKEPEDAGPSGDGTD
jgi:transcriptional regulator with XRE-family HTH domain